KALAIAPQRDRRGQQRELRALRRCEVVDRRAEAGEILEEREMLGRVLRLRIVETGFLELCGSRSVILRHGAHLRAAGSRATRPVTNGDARPFPARTRARPTPTWTHR